MNIQLFFVFFFFLLQVLQKREPGAVRMGSLDRILPRWPIQRFQRAITLQNITLMLIIHFFCILFFYVYINVYRCITIGGKFGMYHLRDSESKITLSFCLKKERLNVNKQRKESFKYSEYLVSSSANLALPYSAAWHLSITQHRGREKHFKSQSAGWDQTRKFDESRQLAVVLPNQNTRGRSVLKTGRSRLRRPDKNRCSAPRRNQEVLQSKHTGEKSVEELHRHSEHVL